MNRLIIISMSFLFSLCVYSQSEKGLYVRNDELVEQIADSLVKNIQDEGEKASFRQAIKDSFDSYWKIDVVQDKIKLKKVSELQKEKIKLDSICKQLRDSITSLKAISGVNVIDEEQFSQLDSVIKKFDSDLQYKKETLKAKRDTLEKNEGIINNNQALLSGSFGIEEELKDAVEKCKGSLLEINVEELESVVQDFNDNKDILNPDEYKALAPQCEQIKKIIPLCRALQDAIHQMGEEKYSQNVNAEKKNVILKAKKGITLSDVQKKECDEIMALLDKQKKARASFVEIINDIIESGKTIKKKEDVEESIMSVMTVYQNVDNKPFEEIGGKLCYNHYYKRFNDMLKDLRAKAPNFTNDYLDKLKNEL